MTALDVKTPRCGVFTLGFLESKVTDSIVQAWVCTWACTLLSAVAPRHMRGTFRLLNLEVHACVVLNAYDTQQVADGAGSRTSLANYLTHVLCMYFKGKKHSHFIYLAVNLHILRMIDDRFDEVLKEFLIVIIFCHTIHSF